MVEGVTIRRIDSVSGVAQDPASSEQLREVSPLQADEAIVKGASLLDVREPDEYDAGHAPMATSIPLGELENRIAELPRGVTIVCVCRSGGRSAAAAQGLTAMGLDAVNLAGGMHAWAADGLAIVAANGSPGTVI
jgi:rhodanese-related sulfurtransferase